MANAVTVKNLSKNFGKKEVFKDFLKTSSPILTTKEPISYAKNSISTQGIQLKKCPKVSKKGCAFYYVCAAKFHCTF